MSERAVEEVEEAQKVMLDLGEARGEMMVIHNILMAKALSLQRVGIIPMESDPDWLAEKLGAVTVEGLH